MKVTRIPRGLPMKEQNREYLKNLLESQPEGRGGDNPTSSRPKLPKGYTLARGESLHGGFLVRSKTGVWVTDEEGAQARAWIEQRNARVESRMSYLKSRIEADKAELEELERKLVAGNIKGVEKEVKDPTSVYGYRTIRFKAVRTSPEGNYLEYLTDDGRIISRFDDNGAPIFD